MLIRFMHFALLGVAACAIAAVLVESFVRVATTYGVWEWDAWAFWVPKAEGIYYAGGLDPALFGSLALAILEQRVKAERHRPARPRVTQRVELSLGPDEAFPRLGAIGSPAVGRTEAGWLPAIKKILDEPEVLDRLFVFDSPRN